MNNLKKTHSKVSRKDLYDRGKNDLLWFGYNITRELTQDKTKCVLHDDIASFHHRRPRFAALISPRGHGKTSWTSTIATVHDIAYDSEDVIVLIKKTFSQATTDLQNITNIIKYNKHFKAVYGERQFIIDRQEKAYIYNPITKHKTWIEVKGAGQSIRGIVVGGKRPTKILLDDFEDENNTTTLEQRQKVREWIAAQVMPSLDPKKGHIMAIGTIVHYDSWLYNLWQNSKVAADENRKYMWEIIFHQVVENDFPIWPERFTAEYIEELKYSYEELGRIDKFWQEYYNIPFNSEDAHFTPEMVRQHSGIFKLDAELGPILEIKGSPISVDVFIGIDPSSGTSSDRTGICVLAVDENNNRYLLEAEGLLIKPDELVDRIFSLKKKYTPKMIVIDEQSMQVLMGYWLRDRMRTENTFLPLKGEKVGSKQKKEDRLAQFLQPIYSSGIMHHKPHMGSLEEELFTFPKGRHDDILDALYYASLYARRATVRRPKKKRLQSIFRRSGIDWMTGARHGDWMSSNFEQI